MQRWKDASIVNEGIFPAKNSSYGRSANFVDEDVVFLGPEGDDACLSRAFGKTRLCIIHTHGNFTDIGELQYTDVYLVCKAMKCTLVAPEYPGYGLSRGKVGEAPTTRACYQAVEFAIANLGFHPSEICLFGRSIGTGAAIQVARLMQGKLGHVPGMVILQSPFKSIKDVAVAISGFARLLANRFNSLATLPLLQLRNILFVHGEKDTLIPPSHSEQLFAKCEHVPNRKLIIVPRADHNMFPMQTPKDMIAFLKACLAQKDGITTLVASPPTRSFFSKLFSSSSSTSSSSSSSSSSLSSSSLSPSTPSQPSMSFSNPAHQPPHNSMMPPSTGEQHEQQEQPPSPQSSCFTLLSKATESLVPQKTSQSQQPHGDGPERGNGESVPATDSSDGAQQQRHSDEVNDPLLTLSMVQAVKLTSDEIAQRFIDHENYVKQRRENLQKYAKYIPKF